MAASVMGTSRVETVASQVRQRIFEGRLPPGSPLRELTIAREFAVSQATVREALQRLEHSGLVTRTTNVGSAVTRLSPEDLRERVELRAMLEVHAAQQAAQRMQEDDYQELDRRLHVMEEAVVANSYYDAAQSDLAFHRYIWKCSANETLCRHLELITVPLIAFVSILRSRGLQRLTTVVEAHQPLIDALRSRDAETIRDTFGNAAVNPYRAFLGNAPDVPVLSAYGFLA
jgi:DNA-binding GntR family transcriptional regulator